jgi:hypothetical protein
VAGGPAVVTGEGGGRHRWPGLGSRWRWTRADVVWQTRAGVGAGDHLARTGRSWRDGRQVATEGGSPHGDGRLNGAAGRRWPVDMQRAVGGGQL